MQTYLRWPFAGRRTRVAMGAACAVAAASIAASREAAAQPAGTLSALVGTFLADSGVRTRGLPFSVGNVAGIRWKTPAPVAANVAMQREGYTLERHGEATVRVGDKSGIPVRLTAYGTALGLQSVLFVIATTEHELTERIVLASLGRDGAALTPLKCDLEKEGASFGNVAYVAKLPGKTASGLWAMWQCPQAGCELVLTILYRRADVAKVECSSGG